MRVTIFIALAIFLAGCQSAPRKIPTQVGGGTYQVVSIGDESFVLDQRTGVIYSIDRSEDGRFDMNMPMGRVGHSSENF